MKITILNISFFLLLANTILASNFYVSPTGSNSNSGNSTSNAWQTIQFGINQINSGDTLFVMDGSYYENIVINSPGTITGFKTLQSMNLHGARIINTLNYYNDAVYVTAAFWNIIGFDIFHENLSVDDYGHGIYVFETSHIKIMNNMVHDNGGSGIQFDKFDYATVENNTCYNNANYNPFQGSGISLYQAISYDNQPGYHIRVSNNKCYNNINITTDGFETTDGNGIIIDDFRHTQGSSPNPPYPHRSLVENNLCYLNGGKGLHTFFSDNVEFYNNTSYHNNFDTLNTGTFRAELSNVFSNNTIWRNNIGISNPGPGILSNNSGFLVGYSDTVTFEFNLTYNGIINDPSVTFDNTSLTFADFPNNLFGVNPIFESTNANDFRLQSNSPCIDSGSDSIFSFIDIDYNIRNPGSVDIGCYEYFPALGLSSSNPNSDFSIFPNPTDHFLTLNADIQVESLVIWNSQGQIVYSKSIDNHFDEIDVSSFQNGVYIIRIKTNKGYQFQKFIKK